MLTTKLIKKFLLYLHTEKSRRHKEASSYEWAKWARKNQLPPQGAWRTWLILAGRGFGKTRTGAETIRQ